MSDQDKKSTGKQGEGVGFELAQAFGSAALFFSGLITDNKERQVTGAINFSKNLAWLFSKIFNKDISYQRWIDKIIQNDDNPLDVKGRNSRTHETLSYLSSGSSAIQLTGGIAALNSSTAIEGLWGVSEVALDLAMGGAGALAYLLIALERKMTNGRLQKLRQKKLDEANGDISVLEGITDEELVAQEDLSDKPWLDFTYNKLPGTLLTLRGLAMVGYGAIGLALGTLAIQLAIPLMIAGAFFTWGGLKDLASQNPESTVATLVESVEHTIEDTTERLQSVTRSVTGRMFGHSKPSLS